jgi:acyl carrier protein
LEKEEMRKKLKEIITQSLQLDINPEDIGGEKLISELNINSVDALEILVWVENNFKITIPDEDLNASLLESLDNLTDYLYGRCG